MRKFAFSMCVVFAVLSSVFCDDKFDALLEKAKAGNAVAQAEVGRIYAVGSHGAYRDFHEVVKWLTKAADQGNADGEYMLGVMYEFGHGVPRDFASTVKWFELAAKQGKVEAQFQLAKIYDLGQADGTRNPALAAQYYQQAAAQGQPTAELRLGQMYENGDGVPQDYATSMKWYLKVADTSFAQYKIGYFYQHGYGVTADRTQALNWYHKAAPESSAAKNGIKELTQ